MKKNIIYSFFVFTLMGLTISCSDFLDQYPKNSLVVETALTDINKANAALVGIYDGMQSNSYYNMDFIGWGEVRGDDMGVTVPSDRQTTSYQFAHNTPLNYITSFWSLMYTELNRVNSLLTAIDNKIVVTTSEAEKATLADIQGQALALRALIHFDITRTHGEPYLKNKTAYGAAIAKRVIGANEQVQRSTVEETYAAIIEDLKAAIPLLKTTVTYGQLNQWGAKALLARVYLTQGNWEEAYNQSVDVINNGGYVLIPNADYAASWSLETTSESIFEIVSRSDDNGDRESVGYVMRPRNNGGYGAVSATPGFIALMKEDLNDVRLKIMKTNDQGVANAYVEKYPGRSANTAVNNIRVIRLSDVYLMAAEAGVYAGKSNASQYLNAIRKRANPTVSDVTATSELVEKERRKELVGEGHRFFDIIRNLGAKEITRTGTSTNPLLPHMCPVLSWNNADTYRLILPVPNYEVEVNPNIYQNAGYTNVK